MTIVYALISREKTVLAEFTATSGKRLRCKLFVLVLLACIRDWVRCTVDYE
jgi:hypothetical protein